MEHKGGQARVFTFRAPVLPMCENESPILPPHHEFGRISVAVTVGWSMPPERGIVRFWPADCSNRKYGLDGTTTAPIFERDSGTRAGIPQRCPDSPSTLIFRTHCRSKDGNGSGPLRGSLPSMKNSRCPTV